MSDRIHELLNLNLQEVFGEGDAARRRAAIEELYTDDCVLYLPPGVFAGSGISARNPPTSSNFLSDTRGGSD